MSQGGPQREARTALRSVNSGARPSGMTGGLLLEPVGCGVEAVARRASATLIQSVQRCPVKDQSWLLAPGSPVGLLIGFTQPVVEGRAERTTVPSGVCLG